MLTDVLIEALTFVHVLLDLLNEGVDILELDPAAHLPRLDVARHELLHGPVLLLLVLEVHPDRAVLVAVGQHDLVVLPVDMIIGLAKQCQ